ncbi:streptomycin 6-kinase [Nocardia kruczakiae]|uniref:Streptomycin 6-kinase n=1 Tax=Nocardia kruczakiae TaxID=261477 RepID=A0ABU1X7H9_9NOCA|nr:aminoglycoside phosphotransferase family protein [Nocardia kruczakiae]MDR7166503.1 streptomycin 6-kinase [Nocardia kruczakiae]
MTVPAIPERLEKAILFLRGEQDGRQWLDALPDRIAHYAREWKLELHSVADSGAMSCCVYATTDNGTAAVLKLPVDRESGATEVGLLERWSAAGAAPEVLEQDDSGVFLMTRIVPGHIVWPIDGPADSERFGELLLRLNATGLPEPPALKDLADVAAMRIGWARERFADSRYAEDMKAFGADDHLAAAEQVLNLLLRTTTQRHILHGDLQAKNILQGPDHWHAIDPLGAVGDINAEAGLWVAIQDGPASIVDRLTELREHPILDENRLHAWTYVFAVAEYRSYLPISAERMAAFVSRVDVAGCVCRLRISRSRSSRFIPPGPGLRPSDRP